MWNRLFASSSAGDGAADGEPPGYRTVWAHKSGPIALVVKASAVEITTAMTLRLEFWATVESGYRVRFPQLSGEIGGFKILASRPFAPDAGSAQTVYGQFYELEPFLAGNYVIPPVEVEYVRGAAQARALRTPRLAIGVRSTLPYRNPIPAGMGIVQRERRDGRSWILPGGTGSIAALAVLSALYLRRRKARAARAKPGDGAGRTALRRLAELESSPMPELFYWRLAEIARTYVQERYAIAADCATSVELLDAVRWSGRVSAEQFSPLEDLLHLCDLVRFSSAKPANTEMEAAAARCRELILRTEPLPGDSERAGALILR